jgi:hypothetical protein
MTKAEAWELLEQIAGQIRNANENDYAKVEGLKVHPETKAEVYQALSIVPPDELRVAGFRIEPDWECPPGRIYLRCAGGRSSEVT